MSDLTEGTTFDLAFTLGQRKIPLKIGGREFDISKLKIRESLKLADVGMEFVTADRRMQKIQKELYEAIDDAEGKTEAEQEALIDQMQTLSVEAKRLAMVRIERDAELYAEFLAPRVRDGLPVTKEFILEHCDQDQFAQLKELFQTLSPKGLPSEGLNPLGATEANKQPLMTGDQSSPSTNASTKPRIRKSSN